MDALQLTCDRRAVKSGEACGLPIRGSRAAAQDNRVFRDREADCREHGFDFSLRFGDPRERILGNAKGLFAFLPPSLHPSVALSLRPSFPSPQQT